MEIEYDPRKREKTLKHRGLDFKQCTKVFNAPHIDIEDNRVDYGEERIITFGFLGSHEVVIVWTQRGEKRRIISMRKANEREQQTFYKHLG
ncbi:MAG: BrnT family toxin [Thiotrichaceae bacterium]|nr:BrnT family toxin [Thiotrichaceae bacterium]